jgi:hypothetical protein
LGAVNRAVAFPPGLGDDGERARFIPHRVEGMAMGRNVSAWILIVLGLALVLSGLVMVYVFTLGDDVAAKDAAVQAAMNPNGINFGPARNSDAVWQYGSAGLSVVIGGVIAFVGMRLRKPARTG